VQYLKCPEGGGKETRLDISNSTAINVLVLQTRLVFWKCSPENAVSGIAGSWTLFKSFKTFSEPILYGFGSFDSEFLHHNFYQSQK